ncbi:MAG TPA: SMC family ATPase [Blastocatellia bacterium]|nr:SMC family ATPase [Blastocatellia bacterium]
MLITRVELENIKNYESASFEFQPGATAICGPNGSGKTSILEAISFALFDYIPYKKEDFLRRGTKRGSVRVSFVSSIDGREYCVYRDTGTGYYIYDPLTRLRLVEQKNQVGAWIKEHLGIEPATDLKTLFTSVVGVPQGNFTSDFADQPHKRKAEFDRVLRVDEYQRSSEELLAVVRLAEAKLADVREDIARLEVQVFPISSLMTERESGRITAARLSEELPAARKSRDGVRQELQTVDMLVREIELMKVEAIPLAAKIAEAGTRLKDLALEIDLSGRARDTLALAAEGFAAHNDASRQLSLLEGRLTERDRIMAQVSGMERDLARVQVEAANLREKVAAIERDKAALESLAPLVQRQIVLEQEREDLRKTAGDLQALEDRIAATDRELKSLRQEYKTITRRLKEIEALKELASRVEPLEGQRRAAEAQLRDKQIELDRMGERRKELARVNENIERANVEIEALAAKIAVAESQAETVAAIPGLEAEDKNLIRRVAELEAAVARDRKTLSEVTEGLCPLLSQRCLNMKAGEGLDQYFKLQAETDSKRLMELEQRRSTLLERLTAARAALPAYSALETMRLHMSSRARELGELRRRAAELEAVLSNSKQIQIAAAEARQRLSEIEAGLKAAHKAKASYEGATPLRERRQQVETEGEEKREALTQMKSQLEAAPDVGLRLGQVDAEIASLDDPRGHARLLSGGIAHESQLRSELERKQNEERCFVQSLDQLRAALETYASLDERITSERKRRAASERDHRRFIENQGIAALLESRQAEFASLNGVLEADTEHLRSLTDKIGKAATGYDEMHREKLKADLEDITNRVSKLEFESRALEDRARDLDGRIEVLKEAEGRLIRLLDQKSRTEEILVASDLMRDMLKKAGPYITGAHLQSISIEANQLYRDITGNPRATLRWDPGYEIVLEEDGHDRAYANLSGGEQMIAALAVRLALLKELSEMRIAFFDEPTSNVDEERRRNLAQQIGRVKDFDQLFVISHDDAFEGYTDHIITLGPVN